MPKVLLLLEEMLTIDCVAANVFFISVFHPNVKLVCHDLCALEDKNYVG